MSILKAIVFGVLIGIAVIWAALGGVVAAFAPFILLWWLFR